MQSDNANGLERWLENNVGTHPFGCVVANKDRTLSEWYGGGFGDSSLFEIGSIRKSFNSALIGRGLETGAIDLNVKAHTLWPELVHLSGREEDRDITLHHLASGVSGWLTEDPPGVRFRYNNAAFTAAERVVARINGYANDETAPAVERLFKNRLGTDSWHFYHFPNAFDPNDIENPGPKLAVDSTLRDLVTWGRLWLQQGKWGSEQVIPADWVRRARTRSNAQIKQCYYGYNWFINVDHALWPQAPSDSCGHVGWGTFRPSGETSRAYLWICPSLHAVAAMVTDVEVGFANDFLDVPMGVTAEWIAEVARFVERERER
jgi:CubicO group peptidase (beta-lactamase class C family)